MVSSLRNVSDALANAVADGLGIELPSPMPRAIKAVPKAEIKVSKALSLTALPGNGGIATRKIAILIADGMRGDSVTELVNKLRAADAVPVLLGSRLGTVASGEGRKFEVDATLENSPAVLFDAVALPDGTKAIETLLKDGHTMEFLKDQYRHCKTILALGTSSVLLTKAGIATTLPSGAKEPGILVLGTEGLNAKAFIAAIAKHRHPVRDMDPPLV
jgi:catalase